MKQSILAIDDELHMLKLMERIIVEKTEYSITTTHNALEVPRILENRQFDVVITDLRMPGLSGMDILRMVREHNRDERVLIITAFSSLESVLEALSLGAYDYIAKPFTRERLIAAIDRAMNCQAKHRQADRWREIIETLPYEEAVRHFRYEYIADLDSRMTGNREEVANKSGLSIEEIAKIINDEED